MVITSKLNNIVFFYEEIIFIFRYDIMNYQRITQPNGSYHYEYVRIGGWDSGNLTMNDNKIFWPNAKRTSGASIVESVCSSPCGKGHVKVQ